MFQNPNWVSVHLGLASFRACIGYTITMKHFNKIRSVYTFYINGYDCERVLTSIMMYPTSTSRTLFWIKSYVVRRWDSTAQPCIRSPKGSKSQTILRDVQTSTLLTSDWIQRKQSAWITFVVHIVYRYTQSGKRWRHTYIRMLRYALHRARSSLQSDFRHSLWGNEN